MSASNHMNKTLIYNISDTVAKTKTEEELAQQLQENADNYKTADVKLEDHLNKFKSISTDLEEKLKEYEKQKEDMMKKFNTTYNKKKLPKRVHDQEGFNKRIKDFKQKKEYDLIEKIMVQEDQNKENCTFTPQIDEVSQRLVDQKGLEPIYER